MTAKEMLEVSIEANKSNDAENWLDEVLDMIHSSAKAGNDSMYLNLNGHVYQKLYSPVRKHLQQRLRQLGYSLDSSDHHIFIMW